MKRIFGYVLAGTLAYLPLTVQAGAPTHPDEYGAGKAYIATLTGAQENPTPIDTDGMGYALLTYNTKTNTLCVALSVSGLSSDIVGAHVHGPADPDENNSPVFALSTSSRVNECGTLTNDQEKALRAGRLYLNIHTEAHPSGEIRGQSLPITGPNYKDPTVM